MKTNFHRRYSGGAHRSKWFLYTITTLLLGALILFLLRSTLVSVVSPIWNGQNFVALGVKNLMSLVKNKYELVEENTALKERLISYEATLLALRTLEGTQLEILEIFGRRDDSNFIAAGVLVHPPETPYDIIIIDAGDNDGVEEGAMVSLPEGGALGRVTEVYGNQSKVELYSGSGVETNAYLERHSVSIKLVGRGGGSFELELPRDIEVEPGDRILLPGIESELVGVVSEVVLEPTDSTKKVIVRGVGNINNVRFVAIH
ncbi:MAG: rod shape-determining protein MreC [Minisyncoccota bacterium]